MTSITALPVAVPLGAAATLLMLGSILSARLVRALTIAATLTETVLAGVLLHDARSGVIVYWFGGWSARHGVAVGVSFAVDRLGAGVAVFSGAIVTAAVLVARRTFEERLVLTHALMLTMLAAMAGFSLTGDIFNLFVFYELMAVSAFGLAAFHTGSVESLRGALNFAITNSVGAFFVLIGIAVLYGRTGALNLAQIGRQLARSPHVDGLVVVAVTTITVGFLVKAAIMPFHFWLVDVASSGPLPLVLVLGGVLDTLAVYAIARLYWVVFAPALAGHDGAFRALLLGLGATSALIGAALSLTARGNRRTIACVLVSHTGTLLVGVGCLSVLGLSGAATYAVAGGAVKAAVIVCGGTLDDDRGEGVPGIASIALLGAAGLALAGLPLFGIARGESVIERAVATTGAAWIAPLLLAASTLTGAAILRIAVAAARARGTRLPDWKATAVPAAFLAIGIGARFLLTTWAASAASTFAATTSYGRAVLDGVKVVPAAAVDRVRIAASGQLISAGSVAVAVAIVAWLDWVRPRTPRSAAVLGATTIGNAIRRLHNGSLGDSVAWLTVGATTFAFVLAIALH
jgi:multicomponent Na+:H+ antiporter subunit D